MKVKKTLMDMIIKWHQAGYSLDEISPLVPQVPKEEIKAIIQQHQTRHNQHKPTKTSQRSPACASSAAENALSATPCARDAMG